MAGTDVDAPARWEREYPAEAGAVSLLRREIARFAEAHGATEDEVIDLTLAISEAATNAVIHAFVDIEPGTVRVVAGPGDGVLNVCVADDGHGMRPRGDSPGLGLGLPTIAQLTTSLDIRAGAGGRGTEVHMTFAMPALRAPAPPPDPDAWRVEILAAVTQLTGSGWPGVGVERLVDVLVPAVADACTLDLVEDEGPRRVAGRVSGEHDAALSAWLAARPPLHDALQSALPALRGGQVHVSRLGPAELDELTYEPGDRERLEQLDMRWWVSVPLTEGGVLLGSLGLGLREGRPDPQQELPFFGALGERAARGLGTTHLVEELRRTRRRLERILSALSEAVTVQDGSGRIVYANEAARGLLGAESVAEIVAAAPGALADRFDITREDGRPVALEDLPGFKVLAGEEAASLLTRSVVRETGAERWLLTKATRLEDDEPFAVNIIEDITEAKTAELRRRLLAQIGEVVATSVDPRGALSRIAGLVVPALADWCAIDAGDRRVAEAGAAEAPRAALSVPVRAGAEQVGTLRLATVAGGRTLDPERREFADDLAGRLAATVQRAG